MRTDQDKVLFIATNRHGDVYLSGCPREGLKALVRPSEFFTGRPKGDEAINVYRLQYVGNLAEVKEMLGGSVC